MSATEKAARDLLEEVLPRIEELEAEALARVAEVEADAREKISRHDAATEELGQVEADIENLGEELERLPAEVVKADLEGDRELEGGLRARYGAAKSELGAAQARRDELWKELAELLPGKGPRHEPHPLDGRIHHTARVAQAAQDERAPLEHLRDRLTKAVNGSADAVAKRHEQSRAQVMSWSNSIQWERSPVGRGAIRQ